MININMMYPKNKIDSFVKDAPILEDIIKAKPVAWLNPKVHSMQDVPKFSINIEDMREAELLWERFAPFFVKAFPETKKSQGILESPLREIPKMKSLLNANDEEIKGSLLLKCDNELPISGSIKARGGFFEIMQNMQKN